MSRLVERARVLQRLPLLNVVLFVVTCVTTIEAGAQWTGLQLPDPQGAWVGYQLARMGAIAVAGLPFAASILAILACHEMGHYLLARAHRVDSTLPFFIPVPGGIGTLGAVIRMRSALPNRRATIDIGYAGPFAGFAVALPLLLWGYAHSRVVPVGDVLLETVPMGALRVVQQLFSDEPLVMSGMQRFGESALTLAVQRLVIGPLPAGHDVILHPVGIAAWFGLFVTTLNLMPLGQLDGGHVTYALLGRRAAHVVSRLVGSGLLLAGLFFSWNWLVWWGVTRFFVKYGHPPALQEEPLTSGRKLLGALALLLFAATFAPVPISL